MSNGTYAKLIPNEDTRNRIAAIMHLFNLENHVSPNDLHVTVVHSERECPELKEEHVGLPIDAAGKAFSLFTNADGSNCLVLELESDDLYDLHMRLRHEHGATHNFDPYAPHMTLSYDYSSSNVPSQTMLDHFWNLKFDKLVIEPLNFDWSPV